MRYEQEIEIEMCRLGLSDLDSYGKIIKDLQNLKKFDESNVLESITKKEISDLMKFKNEFNTLVETAHDLSNKFAENFTPEVISMDWFSFMFEPVGIPQIVDDINKFRELHPHTGDPILPDRIYLYKGSAETSPFADSVIRFESVMEELYNSHGLRFFQCDHPFTDYYIGAETSYTNWSIPLYNACFAND